MISGVFWINGGTLGTLGTVGTLVRRSPCPPKGLRADFGPDRILTAQSHGLTTS